MLGLVAVGAAAAARKHAASRSQPALSTAVLLAHQTSRNLATRNAAGYVRLLDACATKTITCCDRSIVMARGTVGAVVLEAVVEAHSYEPSELQQTRPAVVALAPAHKLKIATRAVVP